MAKINITLDLEWMEDEQTLDEAIKSHIIEEISKRFSRQLNEEIIKNYQLELTKIII